LDDHQPAGDRAQQRWTERSLAGRRGQLGARALLCWHGRAPAAARNIRLYVSRLPEAKASYSISRVRRARPRGGTGDENCALRILSAAHRPHAPMQMHPLLVAAACAAVHPPPGRSAGHPAPSTKKLRVVPVPATPRLVV